MPRFLDLFVHEVRRKKEAIKEIMKGGCSSPLDDDFKKILLHHWHPLPMGELRDFHLFAVDGSRGVREYANGSRFYIARAFALSNGGEKLRLLDTGVFLTKGGDEDIGSYISQRTELVEMKLALESISHLRGSRKAILIDGSLFGRMMHLPVDSVVEGDRGFSLEYMDVYSKLLRECRRENILLVGVSKDSRATFLRDAILNSICMDELQSLNSFLSSDEMKILRKCVEEAGELPDVSLRTFKSIKVKYVALLNRFEEILKEYIRVRPDSQLILNFSRIPGYCTPVELGPVGRTRRGFENMLADPEGFVKRRFRNAIAENFEREEEFVQHAVKVIEEMTRFPTVTSFYLLLDARDTPLRVDVPSWTCGSENTLGSFMESRFLDAYDGVGEVICLLRAGYGGLRNYNIWLRRVDEEVKLHGKDVDALYERLLEKELAIILIHARGYRRVRYP
ncbi:MAG: DNA double-strand break repair nuclease NurA [Candidatus Bathyarchaeia archaeon]